MRLVSYTSSFLAALTATALLRVSPVFAQTYSNCNPLKQSNCPPDSALGRSVDIDFTEGQSDSFTPSGNPTYDSNGVSFTVAKSGDSPQLTSKWYIMFGKVEVTMKAAPGAGIVSSVVLQSDDLDEIDWEWLGADDPEVQSNYFGKGLTTDYNRGAFHQDPNSQEEFKTYTVDWSANQIVWQINGQTVRVLTPASAEANQYPQTPMQLKFGAWSGGDPSNSPGTIQWARGPTDYSKGPFTMIVKSIAVTDYSTGTQYKYTGTDGTWQEIDAVGGSVNSQGDGTQVASSAAPAITSMTNAPAPFEGTHRQTTSFSTPSVYPWVPGSSTLATSTSSVPSYYPGMPSGWTVSSNGHLIPPSSAPSTSPPEHTISSLQASSPASSAAPGAPEGGYKTYTTYDQRGFLTTVTIPAAQATQSKSYDQQGFLITSTPTTFSTATTGGSSSQKSAAADAAAAETAGSSKSVTLLNAHPTSGAVSRHVSLSSSRVSQPSIRSFVPTTFWISFIMSILIGTLAL
ncbi:glycoside hydrolase family 16 protein [Xylona heveae TC161]|uniref:Crh-like protein n=1 Tax=Xylona heveae (strain CBS 132557 / TC161) TaxID=1328760 RepID=A0A165GN82_XYLHT|nr:glycoside hydrolase family 16 protein [Xylona heveae TC161]KZF22395.1 glycoside hydrolase family 16 protein [Xylona heveae TC161]